MNPPTLYARQRATLALIPNGDRGTRATLAVMAGLVREYRTNATLRALAESIIAGVPEKDAWGEAEAIHRWVRDSIRYTGDIYNVETVKDPLVLLETRQGDCDDKTTLAATLLQTIGYPVRLVAIAFARENFSHVFPDVCLEGQWVPMETTENVALGWYPDGIARFLRIEV